jgi:4-oxalomesaconate tautomerase
MSSDGVRCMMMRGGTSKGAYFLASDLPDDPGERDDLLLRIMGSPDDRQIDGLGGAHPLTSKVAVVDVSTADDADLDYLFLQVVVDEAKVTSSQNCGNILAGIAPFALERGLVTASGEESVLRIRLVNSDTVAVATVQTPGGRPTYDGDATIAGVPGSAAPVLLHFVGTEGSSCGALLPTGNAQDGVAGVAATLIDNGMPVVVFAAADLGIAGNESPSELELNESLRAKLEEIRIAAGPLMNLGDVSKLTVPKLTMVSAPQHGGTLTTRTFIPHRCHSSIGVFGAVSVASATTIAGSVAHDVAAVADGTIRLEHPTGYFEVVNDENGPSIVSTARRLFDGYTWPGPERY